MNKKKFYKKWWFWLIVVIIVVIIAIPSGSKSNASTKSNQSNNSSQSSKKSSLTRDNSTAKATSLGAGTFTCGVDINPGRYVIKSADGSGNFVINKDKMPVVNAILDPTGQMGVKTITFTIQKGETIDISGINKVEFTPAVTKESDTLTAGQWVVGLDIAPGRYVASAPTGSGNFIVTENGMPKVNEILDASGQMGVKNVTVSLDKGDVINISSINKVVFEKKN